MEHGNAISHRLKRLLKKEATIRYQMFQLEQMSRKIKDQQDELVRIHCNTKESIESLRKVNDNQNNTEK